MVSLADAVGGEKRLIGGPFGSNLTQKDYTEDGVPVIRGTNMNQDGRWIDGPYAYVSEKKVETDLVRNIAKCGDIIVTQRGTLGQVSIVPNRSRHKRYVVSQSQMAISVDAEIADTLFVYYFLRSPQFENYLKNATIQTGVPHINLGILRRAETDWPDKQAQSTIANVLSALDDKIELNRRTNETLEAMAQAVFKDWFVDFGPVHRKQAGETDPAAVLGGLLPAGEKATQTAALFPDTFSDNGLPEGWREDEIGNACETVGGATPPTKNEDYWLNPKHYWATPKDLSNLSGLYVRSTERMISNEGLERVSSGLSPKGSVLMSSRAPIGYVAIAAVPVAVNQGFIVLRPTAKLPTEYAYFWVKTNMEIIEANANGSTFQEISKKNFRPLPVIMPPPEIMGAFVNATGPLLSLIERREAENQTLAQTRDYLLPKLMSGQIRASETEAILETAL